MNGWLELALVMVVPVLTYMLVTWLYGWWRRKHHPGQHHETDETYRRVMEDAWRIQRLQDRHRLHQRQRGERPWL